MKAIIGCALLLSVVLSSIDLSDADCCYIPLKCTEDTKTVKRCYDCTEATVYCGKGKCNVLGCNCDGGCRQGDSTLWCWNLASNCKGNYLYQKLLSLGTPETNDVNELIARFDKDSDGHLNLYETKRYLAQSGIKGVNVRQEFNKLDVNSDGLLSPEEIDG